MKKTLLILVLILSLIVSAASAAPTRRREEPFGLDEAELMAVQPLLNAVAYAAFQKDIMHYARGTAPSQALVEGILARALEERLFPVEIKGQGLTLSDTQISDMAGKLFAWPDVPPMAQPFGAGISPVEGGLTFDLSAQPDFVGVYVYGAREEAQELLIRGDVYRLSGIEGMAEDAPEDSIAWIGHIDLALKKAQGAPAGHTLISFAVTERYQAGGFNQIFDEENGYELSYPDIFPVHEEPLQKGEALELVSADGQARLRVSFVPGTLAELEATWEAESSSVRVTEYGQLTLEGQGERRLTVPDEQAGQCVVLTYTYPEDKPHEHALYWEYMENSFVVYAHAAG